MKIKIAYLPEESEEVEDILYILTQKRPDAKVNKKAKQTKKTAKKYRTTAPRPAEPTG